MRKNGRCFLKIAIRLSLAIAVPLFLCQCDDKNGSSENFSVVTIEEESERIRAENEQTWKEARELYFSDSDFLQTKQPMSDDAIAPYNYHTGIVGDKAYNQIVYVKALERVRKCLTVKDNQLVLMVKSGAEIHIAEDLFEYIGWVIDSWNEWVAEGVYEIIKTNEGYYDISLIGGRTFPD